MSGVDPIERMEAARAELKSYTDDEPDTGQFDVSKAGIQAKGIPRWAMGVLVIAVAVALVAWAVVQFRR